MTTTPDQGDEKYNGEGRKVRSGSFSAQLGSVTPLPAAARQGTH